MRDIFFKLPRSKAKIVIKEAINISKSIIVEELNCEVDMRRRPTKKTVEEVFKMGLEDPHTMWHFVIRNPDYSIGPMTDIGLSISKGITYFLWINMDIEIAYDLAKKHNLKMM